MTKRWIEGSKMRTAKRPAKRTNRSLFQANAAVETLEGRCLLAGDLVAHWAADSIADVESGADVTSWEDSIGGIDLTAGEAAPSLVQNGIGGRSFLRFDGSQSEFLKVLASDSPMGNRTDFSIGVVFATDSNSLQGNQGNWFLNTGLVDGNSLGLGNDWGVSINSSGQIATGLGGGVLAPPETVYSTETGLNDGQLHSVVVTRTGSQLAIYVDGNQPALLSTSNNGERSRIDMVVGALRGGLAPAANFFTGDIGQVRIYDGGLNANEVTALFSEFDAYYNNQAPVSLNDSYSVNEDAQLSVTSANGVLANDSDSDGDTLTAVVVDGPANGHLTMQPSGEFVYTPNPNFFGVDMFTYTANDFRPGNVATVSIQVNGTNDPVLAVADQYKAVPNQVLNIPALVGVLNNDVDLDNDPLRAILDRNVTNGVLQLNEDGSFTYDPQGFSGTERFTYKVDDGVSISPFSGTVTLIVNTTPQAVADNVTTPEDTPLSLNNALLANDVDPDGNVLTITVETMPTNGVITDNNGQLIYSPNPDFVGSDSLTYFISDGVDRSATVQANIQITSVNDAPTAQDDSYLAFPGKSIDIPAERGVLANDSDSDSATITASLAAGPTNGTLTLQADGSFSYSPNAGVETGVDSFTYRASDGQATTDPVTVSIVISARPVEISEIMASNASTLETVVRRSVEEDFSGNTISPDWIELRNLLSEPVDLEGLFLSDDVSNPTKWQFPAGSVIGGNGYLVVMASGENITDPDLDLNGYLHTNFSLDAGGDSVYVSNLDGQPIHAIEMFPEQRVHISYGGATNDSNQLGYFMQPTPGDANSDQLGLIVADTKFSVNRGFFSEAFALEITTATENATIRYTTNGTEPTLQNGLTYSAPINIAETTTVRAAAFLDGAVPTNVDTNTYVFLADVVTQDRQDSLDAGFPTAWRGTSADYGLDDPDQFPLIAGDTSYTVEEATAILQESLKSIPTVSVVMNSDDLFGDQGIYANPTSSGPRWERATSIELIQPDGTEGFQIDAGIRIQGGAFRGFGLTKKKSFRFLFKNEYGDGKLEYPLFGPDAASEFSTLTLRMESNDGWQWDGAGGQPQYARDQFLRNVQRAMGQPASHGTAIHLYLNGRYWGMYNIVERPDSSFAETYLDTEEYNWDGINSGTSINADGDRFRNSRTQSAWRDLRNATSDIRGADTQDEKTQLLLQLQGLNPDGSDDPETPSLLDVNNMIDYLIINYYGHNSDWPFKNYYVGHENDPTSEGFKFFMWDAEWSLFLRSSVTGNNTSDRSGVAEPFQNLRASDEFNLMFADRVQKHLFNGGVFYVDPENPEWDPEHPERNRPAAIYQEYVSVIYDALIAESARWGDQHRSRPYTRDVEWQREYDRIVGQWFTERTGNLLSIFRRGGLFPDVDAATFNQRGGEMADGFQVVLQSAAGQIYYTLDGSDPRKIGGDLSGSARLYSSPFSVADGQTVRVRVLSNGEWSAIDEATFYSPAVPASADSFRLAEVHYNPGPLTSAELAAGFNDKDEFEFVEFVNVSDQIVDLSNVQLLQTTTENQTTGIGFDFASADDTRLAPGERIVVVENEAAFRVRYGDQVRVAGQWAGGLSNNSEHVTVVSGDDVWYIASYDDDWYPSTDGQGRSLEIVDVDTNDFAVWSTAAGWRASSVDGGTPGSAGGVRIVGDSNGDGVFDSGDLVAVFVAGEYEDGIAGNSTFEEGDWNGDGDFSSADLVLAFQEGTYVAEAQAAESTTDQPIRLVDALPGKASLSELGTVDAVFAAQDSKERDSKPTSAQKAGNDREWYLDDEDWLVV